jgi:hypothetical protein
MSIFDDLQPMGGGNYKKFTVAGDSIEGQIVDLAVGKNFDGDKDVPVITIREAHGEEQRVSCENAMLYNLALANKDSLVIGGTVRIVHTGVSPTRAKLYEMTFGAAPAAPQATPVAPQATTPAPQAVPTVVPTAPPIA